MVRILRENNNEIKEIPIECVEGAALLNPMTAVNLLTQEERKCTYNGRPYRWWLLPLERYPDDACRVEEDGNVVCVEYYNCVDYVYGVRPALILNLNSSNFQIGDIFKFGGYTFKVISNNYALCEEMVGESAFRTDYDADDANNYEMSDIKKFIDDWFKKVYQDAKDILQGRQTDDMIAAAQDFGF